MQWFRKYHSWLDSPIADSGSRSSDSNVLFSGTGKLLHGHVPGAGDPARGGNVAIKTAGRQEVERGLDRIEGKPTITSAAGHTPGPARGWEQGGVSDGSGAVLNTAPQGSTAAPPVDPTFQKAREAAADTRYPASAASTATAGAGVTGTRGHGPAPEQQRHDDSERTQAAATTGLARDRHNVVAFANGPGVQRDTDMRRQGHRAVAGDQDRLDRENAATAPPSDRLTAADDVAGAQRDTDVRQGNGFASSDRDKAQETRTTAGTSHPVNTAESQEWPSGTARGSNVPMLSG